jgi:hypothetical protein
VEGSRSPSRKGISYASNNITARGSNPISRDGARPLESAQLAWCRCCRVCGPRTVSRCRCLPSFPATDNIGLVLIVIGVVVALRRGGRAVE